ncbi:hypothetical protein QYE76_043240 [Lolium multiflorum]|uniref:AP2/ERF domain-containing protein n=1 Tax=Lolium multiflorum TaxID=4521 RepID=A0AAD8TIC7_LOLMU|nr:hypothetical protein QYE76_043240 [Lolium multiflorum]
MPRLGSSSRYGRVSSTGYRGVRGHPKCLYYAEIRDDDERIGLGTYKTAHEAARVPMSLERINGRGGMRGEQRVRAKSQ